MKNGSTDDYRRILEKVSSHYDIPNEYELVNVKLASRLICPFCEGKNVLEVGCASGEMSESLLDYAKSLTIVEPTERFCHIVNQRFGNKIKIHNCFIEELEDITQFDVIVLAGLLHHVKNPVEFLVSVKKFCTKNTIVIATVPNVTSLHRRIGVKSGIIKDVYDNTERNILYQQYEKFDKNKLVSLFSTVGYEVIDCFGYMLKPFSSEQMETLNLDWDVIEALFEIGKEYQELASQLFIRSSCA